LIESAGNLVIFMGLLALARSLGGSGRLFVAYMISYGVLRFVVDFWRASSALKRVGLFSAGQVLALGMVAIASTLLLAGI
jgi:prolipoprotein diacylglyceryltransferase